MAREVSSLEISPLRVVAAAVLVAVAVFGARATGWLERLELAAYDQQVRLSRSGPDLDPHVAVVELTEADIQALGVWPLPDGTLARVIETLVADGARAVGVDIYRDIPVPPGSAELDAALATHWNVIFPSKLPDGRSTGVAPPASLVGTQQVGFNNMVVDDDGHVRRGLLFMDTPDGGVGDAFPLLLALFHLAADGVQASGDPDDPDLWRIGEATFHPLDPNAGSYVDADTGGYQYLVDFRTAALEFPTVELRDVLARRFEPGFFRDRIVVVGVTAESLRDVFNVAVGAELPGAALHAHLASQLVRYAHGDGQAVRTLTGWQEILLIVIPAALGALLGLWTRGVTQLVLSALIVFAVVWGAAVALLGAGWWVPVVPGALALAISAAAVIAYVTSLEEVQRAELMQLFSSHVTQQVAEEIWRHRRELLEGGRPKPQRLTASVLFVDMKDYTKRSAALEPRELMSWLDRYLEAMSVAVLDAGGMVEDYFGDGMMACFGVPLPTPGDDGAQRDALNAVQAALAIVAAVEEMNVHWKAEGLPIMGTRVGISTGELVTGSMGSARRLKYSVVGDAVVTAARIQALDDADHDYDAEPSRVLISDDTLRVIGDALRQLEAGAGHAVKTEPHGEHQLKGQAQPTLIHRVIRISRTTPDLANHERSC